MTVTKFFPPRVTNIFRFRVWIIFFKLLCNLEKKLSHCLVLNMCLHRTIFYISYRYKLDSVGPSHRNQQQIRLDIHTCTSQWCYCRYDWLHKHLGIGIHLNLWRSQNKCSAWDGEKLIFVDHYTFLRNCQTYPCLKPTSTLNSHLRQNFGIGEG